MDKREFTRVIYRAYSRDGDIEITGEALLLACLLHTQGKGRGSDDEVNVRKLMRDINMKR